MARTEKVASSMKHDEGQQLREEVRRCLDRTEDPTPHLTSVNREPSKACS